MSAATSGSAVRMNVRSPAVATPTRSAFWPVLPPSGPVDSSESFVCWASAGEGRVAAVSAMATASRAASVGRLIVPPGAGIWVCLR